MTHLATLDEADCAGKRVFLRADLNLPMKDGRITDRTRLIRAASTWREILDRGGRLILASHFGRPGGKRAPEFSLRPLLPAISEALGGRAIAFAEDCIGQAAEAAALALKDGEVLLLENLRFHAAEEANDPAFARSLAALAEIYIDDAFSCAHRAHASIAAIADLLPAYAGRLMEAELRHLAAALDRPTRPVLAIIGGAKVSTKLDLLGNLLEKVDVLAIGGGMANTFLFAQGHAIGASLAERDLAPKARAILERAAAKSCRILLPQDAMTAAALKPNAETAIAAIGAVPEGRMILDLGPLSVADILAALDRAKTLLWNGPVGAFETPPFGGATIAIARHAALATKAGRLFSVAGGGDTLAALAMAGVAEDFSYASTAGGAFLEWLEGKTLPGVAVLQRP